MNILNDADFLNFEVEQVKPDIVPAYEYEDLIDDEFDNPDVMSGASLPWAKLKDDFRLRSKEVTLWGGVNGHGKTTLLSHICANSLNEKWLIASLEMPIGKTLKKLIKQMGGIENPTKEYRDRLRELTKDNLWIYNQTDTIPADTIIAMLHYATQKLGVKHIILDSLVKCGLGTDDYNGQKEFVNKLSGIVKSHDCHIHLVHHVRKGDDEARIPNKFDVKGAGEITDLVDNVVIVHRNKKKEALVLKGETHVKINGKDVDIKFIPDVTFRLDKQRHTGIEGDYGLYFVRGCEQYLNSPHDHVVGLLGR